jgi:hypothetical protein
MKKITLLLLLSTMFIGCVKKNEMSFSNTLDNGLVAYYPMDGNANDMTRYSNNGVSSALPIEDKTNKPQKALDFVRNEFQASNIPINLKANYTFSFWIKMNSYEDGMAVMELTKEKECGMNPQIWQFQDSLFLTPTTQSDNRIYIYSLKRIKFGAETPKWNHVLWTVDNKTTNMYVNGILIDSKSVIWPDLTNVDLTLGNSGNHCGNPSNYHNQPSKVSIDEVRIYNRVLTKFEIDRLSKY